MRCEGECISICFHDLYIYNYNYNWETPFLILRSGEKEEKEEGLIVVQLNEIGKEAQERTSRIIICRFCSLVRLVQSLFSASFRISALLSAYTLFHLKLLDRCLLKRYMVNHIFRRDCLSLCCFALIVTWFSLPDPNPEAGHEDQDSWLLAHSSHPQCICDCVSGCQWGFPANGPWICVLLLEDQQAAKVVRPCPQCSEEAPEYATGISTTEFYRTIVLHGQFQPWPLGMPWTWTTMILFDDIARAANVKRLVSSADVLGDAVERFSRRRLLRGNGGWTVLFRTWTWTMLSFIVIPTLRLLVALAILGLGLFLDRTGGATISTNVGPLVPSREQGGDGTARNVLVTCAENARGSRKDGLRASRNHRNHRNQHSSLSPPLKSQILNDMRVPSVITARCVQSSEHDSNVPVVKMWACAGHATKGAWRCTGPGTAFLPWSRLGCHQMPLKSWRRGRSWRKRNRKRWSNRRRKRKKLDIKDSISRLRACKVMRSRTKVDTWWGLWATANSTSQRCIMRAAFTWHLRSCRSILHHLCSQLMHPKWHRSYRRGGKILARSISHLLEHSSWT